ncbi:MAG: hypothetical protein DRN25_03080 [Thermoplasmata archaeon]|nr:MAG: hypothetical protein DRN18_02105 [Thermoplasmata archaeon]RLF60284.1 MAG: hypothetical protein DRN25_03080 [Thermoplasmata archaeon]
MIHIPIWLLAIVLIVLAYIGWKILKFAVKIFMIILAALIAVFLLDYFHIFSLIKSFLAGL